MDIYNFLLEFYWYLLLVSNGGLQGAMAKMLQRNSLYQWWLPGMKPNTNGSKHNLCVVNNPKKQQRLFQIYNPKILVSIHVIYLKIDIKFFPNIMNILFSCLP